jgi:DNA-binding transcriptional ArsR family regulator
MNERELEKILKALANKRRLAILKFLKSKREAPVGEIAEKIHLSVKSTSKHLNRLSSVDILDKEQRSLQIFYRISETQIFMVGQIISNL